jgi:hypothetical protein
VGAGLHSCGIVIKCDHEIIITVLLLPLLLGGGGWFCCQGVGCGGSCWRHRRRWWLLALVGACIRGGPCSTQPEGAGKGEDAAARVVQPTLQDTLPNQQGER